MKHQVLLDCIKELEKQSQAQQHELKKAQKIVQLSEESRRELEET